MLKNHHRQLFALLVSFDLVLGALVYALLIATPSISGLADPLGATQEPVAMMSLLLVILWPIATQVFDLYGESRTQKIASVIIRSTLSAFSLAVGIAACAFTLTLKLDPLFPFVFTGVFAAGLAVTRVAIFLPLKVFRRFGRNFRNVLIVGTGPRAAYVSKTIRQHPEWGLRVIGFIDDQDSAIDPALYNAKLFKLEAMPAIVSEQVVDRVIIAYPRSMLASVSPIVEVCAKTGIPFTMLADLFGDFLPPPATTQFGSLAALDFAPVHHNPAALATKRALDIVGASIGLLIAAPFLIGSAIAIKLNDGGPIFFKQLRCGLHGRKFYMYKLRTMCVDAEDRKAALEELNECDGPVFKVKQDPRITNVGRTLRNLSLDELPQLWNVFRGDMSLVGPRPAIPEEVGQYQTFERRRLSMRPGITCIWQVSGRSNIGFDRWVQLDVKYIDSWSLGLDMRILLQTIPAVLKGEGAH